MYGFAEKRLYCEFVGGVKVNVAGVFDTRGGSNRRISIKRSHFLGQNLSFFTDLARKTRKDQHADLLRDVNEAVFGSNGFGLRQDDSVLTAGRRILGDTDVISQSSVSG